MASLTGLLKGLEWRKEGEIIYFYYNKKKYIISTFKRQKIGMHLRVTNHPEIHAGLVSKIDEK